MRTLPLSHRLLWLLLACTTAGFLLLLAPLAQERRGARDQAGLTAANIHAALAGDINQQLMLADRILTLVQEQLADGATMPEGLRQQLEMAARLMPAGLMLTLLDADGTITYDTTYADVIGDSRAWRPFFQEHRNHGDRGLQINGPYAAVRDGEPIIVLSKRLSDAHERFSGVVYATMKLSYFGKLFEALTLKEGTSVTLFLEPGVILARRPYDPQFIGRNLSTAPALVRAIKGNERLFEEQAQIDGITRLYFSERLADYPLRINVAQSIDRIYSEWIVKFFTIMILFIALIAGLGTSLLMLRREHHRASYRRMMRRQRPARPAPVTRLPAVDNVYPLVAVTRVNRDNSAEK